MRIKCLHGFFIFDEFKTGQASKFMSQTGLKLVPWRGAYTFETIEPAPNFSIKGKDLFGNTATKNYAGEPWEIFEQNNLVYNFNTDAVVLISSITQKIDLKLAGDHYISPGLILPGSITSNGDRIKSYTGQLSSFKPTWSYSEVTFA